MLGLAWDCGALTGGPVSVPVLLSLGIGVMRTLKAQDVAAATPSQKASDTQMEGKLEGFGIIALTGIFPVFTVQLYAIYLSLTLDEASLIERGLSYRCQASAQAALECGVAFTQRDLHWTEVTPGHQLVSACRAVLPLFVLLICIVKLVLRKSLPSFTFHISKRAVTAVPARPGGAWKHVPVKIALLRYIDPQAPSRRLDGSVAATWFSSSAVMFVGAIEAVGGFWLFNVGLTLGFASLGSQVGNLIPAAFMGLGTNDALCNEAQLPVGCANADGTGSPDPDLGTACMLPAHCRESPYYSRPVGVLVALHLVFLLGYLSTRAEPGLSVLGSIVHDLSSGTFSKGMLVSAVCIGVSFGMVCGISKILFDASLLALLVSFYGAAVFLSCCSSEDLLAIAWDSAGVTTGPITVPFVLYAGVGCSLAASASDGFGILCLRIDLARLHSSCHGFAAYPGADRTRQTTRVAADDGGALLTHC